MFLEEARDRFDFLRRKSGKARRSKERREDVRKGFGRESGGEPGRRSRVPMMSEAREVDLISGGESIPGPAKFHSQFA